MSKERAKRRAERQAAAAVERERRARAQARAARRRSLGALVTAPFSRRDEPKSALQRQRRRQNGVLAAALVALNAVLWLLEPSWVWRSATVVGSLLAWPVLAVLAFDRRASR
ncbi:MULTISPECIES: hypothetical protein [unclassified Kineosporia]|uniref:hypothetical protein n=1 Tax=unclassified Kineosporia TaxID=2626061 RepID=UPI000B4B0B20|nr:MULTISPECIES: hypothetical protein [unclassified Kineosporia]